MLLKMFFIRMIMKLQPGRRQQLKEEMLGQIRKLVDHTIDAGIAGQTPLPMSDIRAIALEVATKGFASLMKVVGVSETELSDLITEVFDARNKEVK